MFLHDRDFANALPAVIVTFATMSAISNIIFDLGGVLINLDYDATRKSFLDLGVKDFDAIYSQAQQNGLFDALDKGEITSREFRDAIRKHIDHPVSDKEIDTAWDAMLLDVPKEKLELLTALKPRYRTFLLSNTNEIHIANFSSYLQRTYGTPDFTPYFERWYYSCYIRMRKPDPAIFNYVLHENSLRAEETLFIDDSCQHIEGAKHCGLKTAFLEKGKSLVNLLAEHGITL